MYVTQYNPTKELQEFRKGFKYFDSFLDNLLENKASLSKTDFSPTVNTREGEHAYHVEVDLPGVKKEDIHVDINIMPLKSKTTKTLFLFPQS